MSESIKERVVKTFIECFELEQSVDEINIEDSFSVYEDYGINSITFLKLIVALEAEFEFEFNAEDLEMSKFENLAAVIAFIEEAM